MCEYTHNSENYNHICLYSPPLHTHLSLSRNTTNNWVYKIYICYCLCGSPHKGTNRFIPLQSSHWFSEWICYILFRCNIYKLDNTLLNFWSIRWYFISTYFNLWCYIGYFTRPKTPQLWQCIVSQLNVKIHHTFQ